MPKSTAVSMDTSRVVNMLNTVARRAETIDLSSQGRQLLQSVRLQQHRESGRLAGSIKLVVEGDSARVVSDVPYARFNWRGTSRQPAKPPIVGYRPSEFAKDVAAQLFTQPSGGFGTPSA